MKYVEKIITDYKFEIMYCLNELDKEIDDNLERSYFYIEDSKNIPFFDLISFQSQLLELDDLMDRYQLIEFIQLQLNSDIERIENNIAHLEKLYDEGKKKLKEKGKKEHIDSMIEIIKNDIDKYRKKNIINNLKNKLRQINVIKDTVLEIMRQNKKDTEPNIVKSDILEFDKSKKKSKKTLKKFVFQGTEESILRIIDLLYNSGFITTESYKIRNAVIRDTIQKLDENNQIIDFKNNQLSSVKSQRLNEEKISKTNKDYTKFVKLSKVINKIIPED